MITKIREESRCSTNKHQVQGMCCAVHSHSVVSDSVTPWTVALQAPLSKGILQARTLEWVALLFSRGSFQPRD